jgi:uncharacterized membrane protein
VTKLIIGLAIFLGVHSVSIFAVKWRNRMVETLGLPVWRSTYSLLSIVGLVVIVQGYAAARAAPVILYVPPSWLKHAAMLLMMFVFPLLLAAYLPGRINTALKHPMLVAVKTWAVAHLLANGAVADVVLFGAVLVWAVLDRISMRWRAPRPTPLTPPSRFNDAIVVIAGLAIYAAFFFGLHTWLTGIPLTL